MPPRSKFSQRPNLNASDIRGKTALIFASSYGHREAPLGGLGGSNSQEVCGTCEKPLKNCMNHMKQCSRMLFTWVWVILFWWKFRTANWMYSFSNPTKKILDLFKFWVDFFLHGAMHEKPTMWDTFSFSIVDMQMGYPLALPEFWSNLSPQKIRKKNLAFDEDWMPNANYQVEDWILWEAWEVLECSIAHSCRFFWFCQTKTRSLKKSVWEWRKILCFSCTPDTFDKFKNIMETIWQVVDYLLNKAKDSIEVNAVDDTDKTALHHAARRRRKSRFGWPAVFLGCRFWERTNWSLTSQIYVNYIYK